MDKITNFSTLSKFEKFEIIKEYNCFRNERNSVARYLRSLWLNDVETMNHFESFGDTFHKIILNFRTWERNLQWGYEEINFNEYGWVESAVLLDKEYITIYNHNLNQVSNNSIKIARGINGKFTYGYDFTTNTSGSHSGACIWGKMFETREEAIEEVCAKMIKWHISNKCAYSGKVIFFAEEKIKEMKYGKVEQLCFSF